MNLVLKVLKTAGSNQKMAKTKIVQKNAYILHLGPKG